MHRRSLFLNGRRKLIHYLVGYYKFNGNLLDSANNPSNLVSIPNPMYINAKLGLGFDFNSTSINGQALRTSGTKYRFTDGTNDLPFSLSFWMVYRGGGSSFRHIFGRNNYGSSIGETTAEYRIAIETGRLSVVKFSLGNRNNSIGIFTTAIIPTDTMMHITITDNALGSTLIYINGVLQTTTSMNNGTGFDKFGIVSANEGFGNGLGTANNNFVFYGILDDFAIFKGYTLTKDDIDWIYNAGNGRELR